MKNILNKKSALATLFVFAACLTYAQQRPLNGKKMTGKNHAATHWQKNIAVLSKQRFNNHASVNKKVSRTTDAIAERLVAVSSYDYYAFDTILYGTRMGLNDSTRYEYSAARSSTFDYNQLLFDPIFYFSGSLIMGFGHDIGFKDHNNQPAILFDSSWTWSYGPSSLSLVDTFAMSDVQYAVYDTGYSVIDYADLYLKDVTMEYDENRYINTFDSHENITTSYALSWDFGTWDTSQLRKFSYDTLNNVIQDSTFEYLGGGAWHLVEKWVYTLDDSSNITHADYYDDSAGTWQYTEQYYMRYNATNQITWDSVAQQTGGVWMPQASDTFGYTVGLDYITYEKTLDAVGGTPASYLVRTKHITAGLPDTLYQFEYSYVDNTIIDGSKYSFTYDSYNEPIISNQYVFNVDTPTMLTGSYDTAADYITHYYYETYDARRSHYTSADQITVPTNNIKVYPNPATDEISIAMPSVAKGAYTFIKLVNASGQTVHTESLPWLNETATVSMAGLPPGVYWVVALDAGGRTLGKQAVVKVE